MCVVLCRDKSMYIVLRCSVCGIICFFQAEDGIRYLVRSRGLGDVYKRQRSGSPPTEGNRLIWVGVIVVVEMLTSSNFEVVLELSLIHI